MELRQSSFQAVLIFSQQLNCEWKSARTPKGLKQSFANVYTLPNTATEQIFLNYGGKAAWLAYFRSKHHRKSRNKVSDAYCIAAFDELPVECRIIAAQIVGISGQHSTVADIVCQLEVKRRHRKKNPVTIEAQPSPTTSSDSLRSATATPYVTQNTAPTSSATALVLHPNKDKLLKHASQQGIVEVFNPKMCDALKGECIQHEGKTYLKAAIMMWWGKNGVQDCMMTLNILESKVEELAKVLFGVQVDVQQRCLIASDRDEASGSPDPLSNYSKSSVEDIFRHRIYRVLSASQMKMARMELGINSADPVLIHLTLEAVEAVDIRQIIFSLDSI